MKTNNSTKRLMLILGILLLILPLVSAGEITLKTNQTEYWFTVNEDAVFALEIGNTYERNVEGLITTSIAQRMDNPGTIYSSERTESRSFAIPKGDSQINMNFGSAGTPVLVRIGIGFAYDDFSIKLENIIIHFVEQDEQKQENNEENSVNSQNEQQKKTFQELQDKFKEMFEPKPEAPQPKTEQQQMQSQLQNSQLPQDSSAVKKQLQDEMQDKEKIKQDFQEKLARDQQFQNLHEELMDKGYELKSADIEHGENSSGSFDMYYEKQNGGTANINGNMENGSVADIQKIDEDDKQEMMTELANNSHYLDYDNQLKKDGFEQSKVEFEASGNKTTATIEYMNPKNETETIVAKFTDNKVDEVKLSRARNYYWGLLLLLVAVAAGYYWYRKHCLKQMNTAPVVSFAEPEVLFDFVFEARKLLVEAKTSFEQLAYKDAYGKAGQSLRLYLSYKNSLNKELTNDEITRHMMAQNQDFKPYKDCFDLCSMVEFAKYQPNSEDFGKITGFVESVVK